MVSREIVAISGLLDLALDVSVPAVGEEVAQREIPPGPCRTAGPQLRLSPVLLGEILLDFLLP